MKKALLILYLAVLHAGALAAFFYFDSQALLLSLILWQIFGIIGISAGYHRHLAHGAIDAHPVVLFFHLLCGALAGQAGPITWVRVHRTHHCFADTPNDPHSPQQGFFFGHLGWLTQIDQRAKNKHLDVSVADLESNPLILFFEKAFFLLLVAQLAFWWAWGGLVYLLWFGFFRIVLTLHAAWAINSIGHLYGYRNFDTQDNSRNSHLLALLTGGEGYHNNHHRYPGSAKLSVFPGEIDIVWAYFFWLKKMGFITSVAVKKGSNVKKTTIYSS